MYSLFNNLDIHTLRVIAGNWLGILLFASNLCAFVVIIYIIVTQRFTPRIYAWLLILIAVPWLGLILFYFFGRDWKLLRAELESRKKEMQNLFNSIENKLKKQDSKYRKRLSQTSSDYVTNKLSTLLSQQSLPMLSNYNEVEIFDSGEAKFASLLHDLGKANKYIHLQYFIWYDDKLGHKIADILKLKAKQGVEVRVVFDFLGSILTIKHHSYLTDLRKHGVTIRANQRLRNILQFNRNNYRDHRKIAVIDGKIGYFGGMNIGQEYIDGGKKFASWIDAHVKVQGEAVDHLQINFAQTWFLLTHEFLDSRYLITRHTIKTSNPIDFAISGPTYSRETIKQLYLSMISSAKRRIWIQSPYFVPDSAILESLNIAALSGIDVRLIITGVADKKVPYWAAHSYYPYLLQSGVRIFQYKAGFMHSKTLVMDDDFSCVGTMNLDNRSFRINYELNGLFYGKEQNSRITEIMERDLNQSQELELAWFNSLPLYIKIRNALSALLSPIL